MRSASAWPISMSFSTDFGPAPCDRGERIASAKAKSDLYTSGISPTATARAASLPSAFLSLSLLPYSCRANLNPLSSAA
jgi:hypothetical protein